MTETLHVIFGTGPVGCWTARALREHHVPVRAVNQSGKRPELMPQDVEIVAADALDVSQAMAAARGAGVVYQALNPPYHLWHKYFPGLQASVMAAAKAAGARFVSIENLYMYDSSTAIVEDSRIAPRSKKGELRQHMAEEVMAAHERGEMRVATLRSSDYYGPGVLGSALGAMAFGNLVRGKKAQISGSAVKLHSFAYIEDVGRAAATVGLRDEALGHIWIAPHAPACTQGEMVEKASRLTRGNAGVTVISPTMMRLAGLFVPAARASVEMMYEFTELFVVDSTRIQKAFSLQPTPIDEGIQRTVDWYTAHLSSISS